MVLLGIFLSLTPIFVALKEGKVSIELGSQVYWPFIFVLGTVPGVFMNIAEEWVFHDIVSNLLSSSFESILVLYINQYSFFFFSTSFFYYFYKHTRPVALNFVAGVCRFTC